MDITLSSTAVGHELIPTALTRQLESSEDQSWLTKVLSQSCTFVCSNGVLYTGLPNPSLLLSFLQQSCAPCDKLDQQACSSMKKKQKNKKPKT